MLFLAIYGTEAIYQNMKDLITVQTVIVSIDCVCTIRISEHR